MQCHSRSALLGSIVVVIVIVVVAVVVNVEILEKGVHVTEVLNEI
jgi:hypothetical protein